MNGDRQRPRQLGFRQFVYIPFGEAPRVSDGGAYTSRVNRILVNLSEVLGAVNPAFHHDWGVNCLAHRGNEIEIGSCSRGASILIPGGITGQSGADEVRSGLFSGFRIFKGRAVSHDSHPRKFLVHRAYRIRERLTLPPFAQSGVDSDNVRAAQGTGTRVSNRGRNVNSLVTKLNESNQGHLDRLTARHNVRYPLDTDRGGSSRHD